MLSPELRNNLYAMFSDYFAFPDQETSPLFDQEMLVEAATLLAFDPPPATGNIDLLEMQTAYTGLFINRPGGILAHPYGAVYLETEPRLMGDSTRAVLAAYRQAGITPENPSDPPDSLCLELEYMAHLAELETQALGSDRQETVAELRRSQAGFCQDYLHSWLFEFCRRVTDDETAHPMYRWGGQLLERFGRMEQRALSGIPD